MRHKPAVRPRRRGLGCRARGLADRGRWRRRRNRDEGGEERSRRESEELRPPLPFSLPFSFPLVTPSSLSKRDTERKKKLRETRPLTFEKIDEIFEKFAPDMEAVIREVGERLA